MAKVPRAAYVDTSCLVAIAFGEPGSAKLAARFETLDGRQRAVAVKLGFA